MSPFASPRRRLTTGLALLAGLFIAAPGSLVRPPAASAGQFSVSYCRDVLGNPVPLFDWYRGGSNTSGTNATEGCAANYSPMAVALVNSNPGASVSWNIRQAETPDQDPLGIVRWKASGSMTLGPAVQSVMSGTQGPNRCSSGSPVCPTNTTVPWSIDTGFPPYDNGASGRTGNSTDRLFIELGCLEQVNSCLGSSSVQVLSNVVTFEDTFAPTGTVLGGTLTTTGFGAPGAGTLTAKVQAADEGSGIRNFAAIVNGTAVGATAERCAPPYGRMHPCPSTDGSDLAVDTTKVPDGTHPMQIVAVDASGEQGVIWNGQIVVGNGTSIGPGADANLRGTPNGNYGADDGVLTAGWSATGRKPSSKRSVRARCRKSEAYRAGHKVQCNGRAPSTRLTTRFSKKRENIVRGKLVTTAGQPIVGATVQLSLVPRAAGATAVAVAGPVTSTDGSFVARVPVVSGSGTVTASWLAKARDTVPATAAVLSRTVRSSTTFSTSPLRSVRRGRILTFAGTLRGPAGTPQGTAVAIQANAGTSWRAVTTVRARASGRWIARYRVPGQLRGRYRFRAVVKPSAAYPYGASTSSTRRVRVR